MTRDVKHNINLGAQKGSNIGSTVGKIVGSLIGRTLTAFKEFAIILRLVWFTAALAAAMFVVMYVIKVFIDAIGGKAAFLIFIAIGSTIGLLLTIHRERRPRYRNGRPKPKSYKKKHPNHSTTTNKKEVVKK